MFTIKRTISCLLLFILLLSFGCKKDTEIITETELTLGQAKTQFNFEAFINNLQLPHTSKWFTNLNEDSFTVTKFNYYITNIKLKRTDGFVFNEPESYHLIQHLEDNNSFTLNNLPEGSYNQLQFTIGIDSLRNSSGAQTGALDPSNFMFWDWNTGYIFLKLEGDYKTALSIQPTNYAMHIGGYKIPNNYIREITFNSISLQSVRNKTTLVYIHTTIDEIFKNPETIDFDTFSGLAQGKNMQTLVNNYTDMFSISKIANP